MKLSFTATVAFLLASAATVHSEGEIFIPTRISYARLWEDADNNDNNSDDALIWKTLQDVGMISITDVPSLNKQATLQYFQDCLHLPSATSAAAPVHVFPDGTRRRTLATRTVAGEPETLVSSENGQENACIALEETSLGFRLAVQQVSNAMSKVLARGMVNQADGDDVTLLKDATGKSYNIEHVIKEGEHLEHFHCYYGKDDTDTNDDDQATIDWHSDQGLLLIFTPGQIQGRATDGFFVQLQDGTSTEVQFDSDKDDLIVMLADGVNQYVNPALEAITAGAFKPLRSVPHSLQMPHSATASESQDPRVWYGRMVLPPPQALHPITASTFQEMRSSMIAEDSNALSLGCAGSHVRARELSEMDTCNDTISSYCWHECMNYTDYDVSPEICADEGLDLACINDQGLLWTGAHDPDFFIGCIDLATAENVTYNETDDNLGGDGHDDGGQDDSGTDGGSNGGGTGGGTGTSDAAGLRFATTVCLLGGWLVLTIFTM